MWRTHAKRRGPDSRSTEIQRLIGRSLRAAVDLEKMPGVMVTCGHSWVSKAHSAYQHACILLVKNGFVALIVDTISQGERFQFLDDSGKLEPDVRDYYYAHTIYVMGSILVGSDTVVSLHFANPDKSALVKIYRGYDSRFGNEFFSV